MPKQKATKPTGAETIANTTYEAWTKRLEGGQRATPRKTSTERKERGQD